MWSVMLHGDGCLRVVSGDNFTVWPASGVLTVVTEPDSPPRSDYTARQLAAVPPYTLYQPESAPARLPAFEPITFDNNVRLSAAALEGNLLRLQWQMPAARPDLDLQYFAHFVDANGEKIGQRDADFLPGRFWCEGDMLTTQIDVNAPPETVALRVGLYQLDPQRGFINANVVDDAGNPIGTWGDVALP